MIYIDTRYILGYTIMFSYLYYTSIKIIAVTSFFSINAFTADFSVWL